MTAVKQPDFITVSDYLAGEKTGGIRREYPGGTVHAMAKEGKRHDVMVTNAILTLGRRLCGEIGRNVNGNTKLRIELRDETRLYYPDVMVICDADSIYGRYQERPVVVIEVLSDSTRRADLVEKRDAYLTIPCLKVLMLVEPDSPFLTMYRRKPNGGFAVEHHTGLESSIPLPEIESSLTLADLYERAELIA